MALAILLGGIFGLLVAGGVLAAGTIRQARRDQDDINGAFAEARGEAHDRLVGPAPWSSFDMEVLGEDGESVDPSDPYATLTGVSAVSWSHSAEANGADDTPYLEDAPTMQLTAEPHETFVAEPHQTFVLEPEETFVAEPHQTFVLEPETFVAEPERTFVAQPEQTFVAEPEQTFVAEPEQTFVAEPVAALSESVADAAAPARIDEERPVLWRAPAESQVIILVVALRALADGLEATLTSEGAGQLNGLDDAIAHARDAVSARKQGNGNRNGRQSSIDVDGHDRLSPGNRSGSSVAWEDRSRGVPRRSAPSRRHDGPKRITWRAGRY